jgi:hypothetical protein
LAVFELRAEMMLSFGHSDERIVPILLRKIEDPRFSEMKIGTWLIFDTISLHQKSNPRDEIAEPPGFDRAQPNVLERRSVTERQHHFTATSTNGQGP